MKTSHLFAGAVFVLGCVTGSVVKEFVVPARAQAPAPLIFHYSAPGAGWDVEEQLNSYGQRGWRFVGVVGTRLVFERASTPYVAPRPVSPSPPPSYVPPLAPQQPPPAPAPKQ